MIAERLRRCCRWVYSQKILGALSMAFIQQASSAKKTDKKMTWLAKATAATVLTFPEVKEYLQGGEDDPEETEE